MDNDKNARIDDGGLSQEVADLIAFLVNPRKGEKVLVVESGSQVAAVLLYKEDCNVVPVERFEEIDNQTNVIDASQPYDAAVVLTSFHSSSETLPKLSGWDLPNKPPIEDWLIAYATNHLKDDGRLVALVPNGALSSYTRSGFRNSLLQNGLVMVATIPIELIFTDFYTRPPGLIVIDKKCRSQDRTLIMIDGEDFVSLPPLDFWSKAIDSTAETPANVFRVSLSSINSNRFLVPHYYDPSYLQIKPPAGYYEVPLSEIADVRGGIGIRDEKRSETKISPKSLPYLQVRHLSSDGSFPNETFWVEPDNVTSLNAHLAKPGDILVTVGGTLGKVTIVPPNHARGVVFDTSLRCIHVDKEIASPEAVFEFLKSDIGQLQFKRIATGTVIPMIPTPMLESMPIFLRLKSSESQNNGTNEDTSGKQSDRDTTASYLADLLQATVVDYLKNVGPNDTSWTATVDSLLRQVLDKFGAKPLDRAVLDGFPAPIAIPYRRYQMASHNDYECQDRMVSLVESCIYFAFHILLVDYCTHKWEDKLSLSRQAQDALKGRQSIDYRLKFIREVLDAARQGKVTLYMPELMQCDVVEVGDMFREHVRNPIAHSAPGSEPYVRSLIKQYEPEVKKLLESFRFLCNYSLCRIRSHIYKNGRWSYFAEFYKGAEYDINIHEGDLGQLTDGSELIAAERDHLVLLNADNDILDLHPFYQLYFGDETCRESHLCFYKYRQGIKLIGESIRSGLEITLSDFAAFQSLTGVKISSDQ